MAEETLQVVVHAKNLPDPLLKLLLQHTQVKLDPNLVPIPDHALTFTENSEVRGILVGESNHPLHGLVEIMDNNPLVCAQTMSVPSPSATLALIAIAPLLRAGLINDEPVFQSNMSAPEDELIADHNIEPLLYEPVWDEVDLDTKGIAALNALVPVLPSRRDDIADLYHEAYGRSFFVRLIQAGDWDTSLVAGTQIAALRVADDADDPQTELVRIRVMAEPNGKCGAGQVVHAMNVMCGFEEHLGVI